MNPALVVASLSETAEQLREDMELMKAGVIKCDCLGSDVTQEHVGRLANRLAEIEAIIDAHRKQQD